MVEVIRTADPDVAGLQEVRRLQLRYLRAHLPEYGFLSRGRTRGRQQGEHCPILYRRDRYTVAHWEVRWFGEGRTGRIATLARLVDGAGEGLWFADTHLDHRSRRLRVGGGAALAGWVAAWSGPWIVTGDFNATADDPSVTALLDAGLHDAAAALPLRGKGAATAHRFTGRADGRRIDHILVSPDFEVEAAEIARDRPQGRLPSDHWPVTALLRRRH